MDSGGEDKVYLCKYQVESMVVMKGSEKIEMDPSNILSIEYLCDYEFNIFAMVKVTLRLDVRKRIWILKNKKEITAKLTLNSIGMDTDLEEFIKSPEKVWDQEFGIYFTDEDEATDVDVLEERIALNEGEDFNSNDIQHESYHETQNLIDLYLFHPKLLEASRKTVNRVFTEATLQDIVAEILTETKHLEVLMSKFENDETYKELLIPALPTYKTIIYLDQYMGLYKEGSIIFYDVDTLYILNANGKVTAKREDEITEIMFRIPQLDKSNPGSGMIQVSGDKSYQPIISEMDINPQNISIGKNSEIGSTAKIVTTDSTDITIEEADQSYIGERNEQISYVKSENKFHNTIVKKRMEENECILYINAENLDISAFKPNRIYKVCYDETLKQEKYGKNEYRIAYAYHHIKAESDEYMSSSHRILLKRSKGPTL